MDEYNVLYLLLPPVFFAFAALMTLRAYHEETSRISGEGWGDRYRPKASRGKVMVLIMHMATPLVFIILTAFLATLHDNAPSPMLMGVISVVTILSQVPVAMRTARDVAYNPNPDLLPDEIVKMPYSPERENKKREYYERMGLINGADVFGKRLVHVSLFEIPLVLGFTLFFQMLNGGTLSADDQYLFLILSAAAIPGAVKISQMPLKSAADLSRSMMTAVLALSPSLLAFLYLFIRLTSG